MAIIGIDLGTTNSLCAYWKDGKSCLIPNHFGEYITPSVVSVDEENNILVGKPAKERLLTHAARTVSSYKMYMGTDKEFMLGDRRFTAKELSALVLRQLKEDAERFLQEEISEAIISVPAYFNDKQRNATKAAGELAGLKVDRIINEPSAAALAYKKNLEDDRSFVVFDLGGGTLDITIVDYYENIVEILAISGDTHFGGDDFDRCILDYFLSEHQVLKEQLTQLDMNALRQQAEMCKLALSDANEVMMVFSHHGQEYSMQLDRARLIKLLAQHLLKIKELLGRALHDAGRVASEIDDILLVGGSSKMPVIQNYLASLMQKEPNTSIHPDYAIALGTGVVAGIRARSEEIKDIVLTDICPFTLGLNHYDSDAHKIRFFPMIQRNSTLPCSVAKPFTTVKDNQKQIKFSVYQGESLEIKENLLLDQFAIPIPPKPEGEVMVLVTFSYDLNSILVVHAECIENGQSVSRVITNDSHLSDEEKRKRAEAIKAIKRPSDDEKNKNLLARAQKLYETELEPYRSILLARMNEFAEAIEANRKIDVVRAQNEFSDFLAAIDSFDVWR